VILPDTSAWVEYLRATGSVVDVRLTRAVDADELVVVTEPVLLEVLAGARSSQRAERLRDSLLVFPLLTVAGLEDHEAAAAIYGTCRAAGRTIGDVVDCLIAAVAIRHDASVLHRDRDFDTIARHTDLRIERIT
jgi:predicted nucleic acid-binding protein